MSYGNLPIDIDHTVVTVEGYKGTYQVTTPTPKKKASNDVASLLNPDIVLNPDEDETTYWVEALSSSIENIIQDSFEDLDKDKINEVCSAIARAIIPAVQDNQGVLFIEDRLVNRVRKAAQLAALQYIKSLSSGGYSEADYKTAKRARHSNFNSATVKRISHDEGFYGSGK